MPKKGRFHEVADICPPPGKAEEAISGALRLKKLSNLFGFSLVSQFLIAFLINLVAIGICWLISAFTPASISFSGLLELLQNPSGILGESLNCVIYFSYMFIPFIFIILFLRQRPFSVVPVRKAPEKSLIIPSLAVVILLTFLSSLITEYIQLFLSFIHLQATSPDFAAPSDPVVFALYFFQIAVLAPLCEEFLFRGAILQNLRPFGNGFAVVISAILFSMVHGNLLQMPLAFLMGIAFGIFCIESGSIWLTVLLHASVNALSVLLDLISNTIGGGISDMVYIGVLMVTAFIAAFYAYSPERKWAVYFLKLRDYKKSLLPNQFQFKKFMLTPGFLIFAAVIVFTVLCYTTVI